MKEIDQENFEYIETEVEAFDGSIIYVKVPKTLYEQLKPKGEGITSYNVTIMDLTEKEND